MSETAAGTLVVTVHGEGTTPEARWLTWIRVLSTGLRRVANPLPAVADGTAPLSATIRYRLLDEFFSWKAPVQATVAFRVNLDQVVSIRVRRHPLAGRRAFVRNGALNIFPRNEESDHPLEFMWLGVTFHLAAALAGRAVARFREWIYVRYGGPMPAVRAEGPHPLYRLARPVTGEVEIDIQRDENLHFEAVLATGELFHASVDARLPSETYRMRQSPLRFFVPQPFSRIGLSEDVCEVTVSGVPFASIPLDRPAKAAPAGIAPLREVAVSIPSPAAEAVAFGKIALSRIPVRARETGSEWWRYWRLRLLSMIHLRLAHRSRRS